MNINVEIKLFCNQCAAPMTAEIIGEKLFVNSCKTCDKMAMEKYHANGFNEGCEFGKHNAKRTA